MTAIGMSETTVATVTETVSLAEIVIEIGSVETAAGTEVGERLMEIRS